MSWGLNPGPHSCTILTLLTKLSVHPTLPSGQDRVLQLNSSLRSSCLCLPTEIISLRFPGDFSRVSEITLLSLKLEKACVPLSEALPLSDEKHPPQATLLAPSHPVRGRVGCKRMGSQFCIWECFRLFHIVCALPWMSTGKVRKSKPVIFGVLPRASGLMCRRQGPHGSLPPRAFIDTDGDSWI